MGTYVICCYSILYDISDIIYIYIMTSCDIMWLSVLVNSSLLRPGFGAPPDWSSRCHRPSFYRCCSICSSISWFVILDYLQRMPSLFCQPSKNTSLETWNLKLSLVCVWKDPQEVSADKIWTAEYLFWVVLVNGQCMYVMYTGSELQ